MRTTVQDGCRWRCIRLCRLARPGWWRHLVPERPRASLHCPTMQGMKMLLRKIVMHWMVIMVVMVIIMICDRNSTAEAQKV